MKIAAISLAAWTGLALIFYLQRLYFVSARGSGTAWNQLFLEVSIVWGTWAALTPLVLYIVRRISLSPEWPWRALVHVPTGIGVALLHSLLVAAVTPLFIWKPSFLPIRDIFRSRLASAIASDFLVYLLVAAVLYSILYAAQSRERQIAVAQAEASVARAQLGVLQMRLQPHFLFNALNSVLALVHQDPARADLMIRRLSDLLRHSLSHSDVQEVSLLEELDVVKGYLEIQKIRFEDRLSYEFDIDSDTLNAAVPNFLLQPLVENAIKYSMIEADRRTTIEISARARGDTLELVIRDDGPGFATEARAKSEGTGIASTRERLQQLFGPRHRLNFSSAAGKGLTVSIDIPLRALALSVL